MQIKSAVGNWVCIKPDNTNNKIKLSGGTTIFVDDGFNRGEWDVCSGTVVAAPEEVLLHRDYEDLRRQVITTHPNVQTGLQPGDKVWFNHNAFANAVEYGRSISNPLKVTGWDGHQVEYIWLDCNADHSQMEIYAFMRDGLIHGYLDHVVGKRVNHSEKKTQTGIIINALEAETPRDRIAKVLHPGTWCSGHEGDVSDIKEGDHVLLDEYSEIPIDVDGEEYVVFMRERVLAVIDETAEITFKK